ncbi:c-type cytochrome [Niveispirillum fermenti]|uniref:c-type cytochrome n=1 Tax=Niveispirillum fermenti TaxID=1233113 RepID=UPI003A8753BD
MKSLFAALALTGVAVLSAGTSMAQDAAKGEAVFKKCMACHRVGPDARNLVGPILNGIVGRTAGKVDGYKYSEINHNAGEAGLAWTEEALLDYLADPNGYLKKFLADKGQSDKAVGATKMAFRLPNEQERRDVIAFLKTK